MILNQKLLTTVSFAILASSLAAAPSAWADPCKVVSVGQTNKLPTKGEVIVSVGLPAQPARSGNAMVSAERPQGNGNVVVSAQRPQGNGNVVVSGERPQGNGNVVVSAERPQGNNNVVVSAERPQGNGNVVVSGARPGSAAPSQPGIFVRVAGDGACDLNIVVMPAKKKK